MRFVLCTRCTIGGDKYVLGIRIRPGPLSADRIVICCCLSFVYTLLSIWLYLLYVLFFLRSTGNLVIGGVLRVRVSKCLNGVRNGVGDCFIGT